MSPFDAPSSPDTPSSTPPADAPLLDPRVPAAQPPASAPGETPTSAPKPMRASWNTEDWWAIVVGLGLLLVPTLAMVAGTVFPTAQSASDQERARLALRAFRVERAVLARQVDKHDPRLTELDSGIVKARNALVPRPLQGSIAEPAAWDRDPRTAFFNAKGTLLLPAIAIAGVVLFMAFAGPVHVLDGTSWRRFALAFVGVFLLGVLAFLLANQKVIKHYNFEYAIWALAIGLVITNTIGLPRFLQPAVRTEFYIKTGLVLLGAEVLMNRLLALGVPGMFVSWVVTPITLISTYLFGQYVLRIPSRALNMVICADMSVCGVSAAIATGAACRAKKEELSLAIGLSLAFTAIMMVVMPAFIQLVGMDPVLAGAWIGGTIDSTGAVAAAGGMLGSTALDVATTVKMIQNILIGVVAFFVALYWVSFVEPTTAGQRPHISEIWLRFPKFILGFVGVSLICSLVASYGDTGQAAVDAVIGDWSKTLRSWLFCLAFVSIGLETNVRELSGYLKGGKPLVLYVVGQTLNLALTFCMAYLMFKVVFPTTADRLGP